MLNEAIREKYENNFRVSVAKHRREGEREKQWLLQSFLRYTQTQCF